MKFENLVFKPHKADKIHSISTTVFIDKKNSLCLSVIAGPGFYCNAKEENMKNPTEEDFSSFEVAIIDESKEDLEYDVRGWQTRKDIDEIFKGYDKKEIPTR
jgi:hypothetical protein